mgnify:CR=1 FL=1|tara:strand:- start:1291 stop:1578 length:288 start_codon:yes stop_codon:yes gene_type:complete
MAETVPVKRSESPVLLALEAATPSVMKKTGTLGKLFETKTASSVTIRSGSPPHDARKGKAKKPWLMMTKQMSFIDEHGRSVRGRQSLKLQADQRN